MSLEDKELDKYIDADEKNNSDCKNNDDHKKKENKCIVINCNLEVEIDPRNKIIYLCPGKVQFFTAKVLKSCGEVTIKYAENCCDGYICGKLGVYKIIENGIMVRTNNKLHCKDIDVLCFEATDACTNEYTKLAVVFSYDPCKCCIGCHKDCCD